MAVEIRELVNECCPKHSRMITAIMKHDKETEEEYKKRRTSMKNEQPWKKQVPTAWQIARAYRPLKVATPQTCGWIKN